MGRISPMSEYCMVQLFVLLQVLAMIIQPSSSNDLLNKVCIYTNDPKSCIRMFNEDSRTPGADLSLLGEIGIDHALVQATDISNLIIWKNNTATDGRLKQIFNYCFDQYDYAKDMLVNASDALQSKSYEPMFDYANNALYASLYCERSFRQPPPIQSPITVPNVDFFHMCQAITEIARGLYTGIPKKQQQQQQLLHV